MPRLTTCEKNVACGINSLSRWGMFSCPSGMKVSSSRAPPPNVTTTALPARGETIPRSVEAAKAAALAPGDSLVLSSLVIYYSESGQLAKAAEAQARYAALVPRDPAAREKAESLYFEAVQPLLQQQKFAAAIAILNQAGTLL